MAKFRLILIATIIGLSIAICPVLYFTVGPKLEGAQLDALLIISIIAGASALYCFIVGQITGNNSQMDKLWSLLPEIYMWIIAWKGNWDPRLIIMAILATLWGIRLTFNFARKGAYHIKFWEGKEDYRWKIVRNNKVFQKKWAWMLFNLLFISIYQNVLIALTVLPGVVSIGSSQPLCWIDYLATGLVAFFILYETVADEQQWMFQETKWKMINSGKKLEDLPAPFNKGFNTTGLWSVSRHPNYFAEQMIWLCMFIFSISALRMFNWSIIGGLLLVVLFLGSSSLAEGISGDKYPLYKDYVKSVSRYIPWKKYKN